MYLRADFAKGNVSDIEWAGSGCSISEASASIMSQLLIGLSVDQAQNAVKLFRSMLTDPDFEMEDQTEEILGDAVAFYSVRDFPVRIKCALLAWMGTQNLLEGNADG
jgi:nitrogen fixation NifU-like protein